MSAATASPRQRLTRVLQHIWADRGAASSALLPSAWAFQVIASLRKRLYARGHFASSRLPVPVIVVGNLVVGGAGKTPTVMAIVTLLRERGYAPGIVSRGYGRDGEGIASVETDSQAVRVGDEPLLLRRRTGVPVVVGRDRVAAGHALLRSHPEVDIVVSDDGLQHLALERDVEVLVFDERGAGNGRLLPAGPLREPVPSRLEPTCLVVYNADRPSTALPGHLATRRLAGVVPLEAWWRGEPATPAMLESLRGRSVVAVAGLARPQRFFTMLRAQGIDSIDIAPGDHHDYIALPWPPTSSDVVITEKDAVKLPPSRRVGTRVWVAALDFTLDPAFAAAIFALLPPPRPSLSSTPSPAVDPHGSTSA
jgi:tetraacyldisaccharide 4'-kinase